MTVDSSDAAYQFSRDIADWAHRHIQGKSFSRSLRLHLASASYDLALEHQRGMNALFEAKTYGSLLALVRCAAEAFARGYWILYLADERQLDDFRQGHLTLTLEALLKKIADDNPTGPHKRDMQRFVQRLNGLNHGGLEHLALRMSPTTSGPQYSVDGISAALEVGVWIASMSAVDIVGGIVGDDTLAKEMLAEFSSFSNSYSANL